LAVIEPVRATSAICLRIALVTAVFSFALVFSPFITEVKVADAKAQTFCETNALGDQHCITATQNGSKFVASMRWTYLNTKMVGGYNAKYSEWNANVNCRTRTGVVTKVLVKGSNNVTLPILGAQLSQMRRGLQNNAMSKLIYLFCG
jgi:hypothetical protein